MQSGSPSSLRFNASMIDTTEDPQRSYVSNIGDARAEISTGQIAVTGKKGHNSLNWNAFLANEDLLETRFRAPCIGSIGWHNSQSGQRGKSVKRKAATKDNKEGGDDDVRNDCASFPLSVIDHVQHGKWNKRCMEHLHLLHEGPWLHINEKVCDKVELYDFK